MNDLRSLPTLAKVRFLRQQILSFPGQEKIALEYLDMLAEIHGGEEPLKVMRLVRWSLRHRGFDV